MKNTTPIFLALIILFTFSCSKDNDLQAEQEVTPIENEIEISTADQQAIFDSRSANNAAIKRHDAPTVASIYTDNFFILTSTNGLFTGKEKVRDIYQSVFDGREEVIFIRTPSKITVNQDWEMASENGTWVGTWKVDGVDIEVGGDYYAKWHKIEGSWKLRSEVYTQFDCSGEVVCSNKPTL